MELRIHIPDVKIQTDPQKMEDAYSMMIALQLNRGLLRYNASGDIIADLAESWATSPDNLTYRFKLKNSTFSDGTKITSKHVQMSFARLFYLSSSMAADIDYISGVEEFKKHWDITKLGIIAVAPDLVEFRLSHPSAIFLKQVAVVDCSVLAITDFKREPSKNVSSGPFKLINATDSEFVIEKWRDDNLDSKNPPKKITFFKSSEKPEILALNNQTDSLDHDTISDDKIKDLNDRGWSGAPSEVTWEVFVILNPKYVPLELRNELYSKINPKELIEMLGETRFTPAYGLIPNGFVGTLGASDVTELRKINKAYNGKKVSFKLDYLENSELDKRIVGWLKNKWDSKNIEVILNAVPQRQKLERMFSKSAEATIGKKGTDYPDGYSVLTYFKGKYESNYFHVNDPKIDDAISDASREFNIEARTEAYKKIQRQILKHFTNVPLYFGSLACGLWSPKIASVPSHPLGFHTMSFESVEMRAK